MMACNLLVVDEECAKENDLVSYVNIIIAGKVRKRESINQGLASHSGAPTRPTWTLPV